VSAEKRVLVIIPAWNEAASIADVIAEIHDQLPAYDVLVVNDGSTDDTERVALAAGARVVSLPYNLGVGGAMRLGYRYADENDYDIALQIDADVRSGSLKLLTKPGIVVDTDDVAVRSGSVKVRAPWGPEVPVILQVQVSGKVGSGNITARPPRRNFWQWLLRHPRPYAPAAP